MIEQKCAQCAKKFKDYASNHRKFCSQFCRAKYQEVIHSHNCSWCGKLFSSKKSSSKYCSMSCSGKNASRLIKNHRGNTNSGEKHWNWKRGWNLNSTGYIEVNIGIKKRKYQHRLIMEAHLGRELLSTEQVHHINHDKTDNRIENLIVLTPSEHTRLHLKERWG